MALPCRPLPETSPEGDPEREDAGGDDGEDGEDGGESSILDFDDDDEMSTIAEVRVQGVHVGHGV